MEQVKKDRTKEKIVALVSIVILLSILIFPAPFRNYLPFGFGILFAFCGGFSAFLQYTLGVRFIDDYPAILKKHKIEFNYLGANPHINLKEVAKKLKDEPEIDPILFTKIENHLSYGLLAIYAFFLMLLSALLLFV